MPKTKDQKKQLVQDIEENMKKSSILVFVDFTGLEVKPMEKLRKAVKAQEGRLLVTKKTLLEIAFQPVSQEGAKAMREAEGSLGVLFGFGDPFAVAKELWQFSKEEKHVQIIGSFFENEMLTKEQTERLAQLPSREQLLGQLVGTMASPMRGFATVLQSNIKGLVFTLQAIQK